MYRILRWLFPGSHAGQQNPQPGDVGNPDIIYRKIERYLKGYRRPLPAGGLSDSMTMEDVGLDRLDLASIVLEIGDEIDVPLTSRDMNERTKISDIAKYIETEAGKVKHS